MVEWITCHGWGLNPSLFSHWEEVLPEGVHLSHCDRGYLSPPRIVHFSPNARRRVLFVHSFGLHWCPEALMESADHLVILSGFARFHPENPRQSRISRFGISRMKRELTLDPEALLREFHIRVFDPSPLPELEWEELDSDLLQRDLAWLDRAELDRNRCRLIDSCTVVSGGADRILQSDCRDELLDILPNAPRRLLYSDIGHAAGIENPTELFDDSALAVK